MEFPNSLQTFPRQGVLPGHLSAVSASISPRAYPLAGAQEVPGGCGVVRLWEHSWCQAHISHLHPQPRSDRSPLPAVFKRQEKMPYARLPRRRRTRNYIELMSKWVIADSLLTGFLASGPEDSGHLGVEGASRAGVKWAQRDILVERDCAVQ